MSQVRAIQLRRGTRAELDNYGPLLIGELGFCTDTKELFIGTPSGNIRVSPMTVSKSDVGLGNVQNYGIATQAQAQEGTANDVYMTPLRVKEAISALAPSSHTQLTATLNTDGWAGTKAPFTQVQTVSGVLATDVPIVDVVLSGDWEVDKARLEAWGYVYRIVTGNGSITAYASEKPEVALPLQLKVVR